MDFDLHAINFDSSAQKNSLMCKAEKSEMSLFQVGNFKQGWAAGLRQTTLNENLICLFAFLHLLLSSSPGICIICFDLGNFVSTIFILPTMKHFLVKHSFIKNSLVK